MKSSFASVPRPRAWVAAALLFAAASPCRAGEELSTEELSELSLEELLDVSVLSPAAITHLDLKETPASLTSLTAEEIRLTPARNLYDLIEIYVPGAIWMNFEEGPLVGVRGSIGNQNSKYLLLVNGKVLSSKDHYGAKSELEAWDLGDIRRVDIIRGPGSVTYGPGAVAGVISITTHDAESLAGTRIAGRYVNVYGTTGGALSRGSRLGGAKVLAYASVTRTPGHEPLNYQGSNDNHPGYVGKDIRPGAEPLDYFSDYQDIPQAKLHLDASFPRGWKAWARYTQQGATWSGNEVKTLFEGDQLNQQSTRDRQFSGEVGYSKSLRGNLDLQARAGAVLFDVERRMEAIRAGGPDDPQNFKYNFSETEYMAGARFNWLPKGWLETALGLEVTRDSVGPGWWDGRETMRLGGDGIIVSGPDSRVLGAGLAANRAVFAGDGWSTYTWSAYAEGKVDGGPWPTLLVSGRVDKNSHSRWLFSPRGALIQGLPAGQTLKAIVQRSMHRNESGELYIEDRNGTTPTQESLVSYEAIYQAQVRKSLGLVFAYFYNDADIISWNPAVDRTVPLGRLQLAGLESEVAWTGAAARLGANYSILELVDWRIASGIPSSGISYSQYAQPLRNSTVIQGGYGADLNNWPNQAFKAFGDVALSEQVRLHADAQFLWDYRGSLDGLAGLEKAMQGDSLEAKVEESLRKVREEGVFGLDTRINVAVRWRPLPNLEAGLFILNLLGEGGNRRMAYDEGNNRASPHRIRFIREERAAGLTLGYTL